MMPQSHFVVAAIVTLVAVLLFHPDLDLAQAATWVVVATDLRALLGLLHRKGLLVKVAIPHLTSGVVLTVASYYLTSSLFVQVFLGAWSHLVSDVPYVWSVMRGA